MTSLRNFASLVLTCVALTSWAWPHPPQGSQADYTRSAELSERYRTKTNRFDPDIQWLTEPPSATESNAQAPGKRGTSGVWWATRKRESQESAVITTYTRVSVDGQRITTADPADLGLPAEFWLLPPQSGWSASRSGGQATQILFENTFDREVRLFWAKSDGGLTAYGSIPPNSTRPMSTYAGHVWVLDFKANDLAGVFIAKNGEHTARITERSRDVAMRSSPEVTESGEAPRLRIQDHNVMYSDDRIALKVLSSNGTDKDSYQGPIHWSPDRKRALIFQATQFEKRKIPLIASSPKDQVQPELSWHSYAKPGDPVSQRRPRLFNVDTLQSIPVNDEVFADSYQVNGVHWSPDSQQVFCLYNKRGHQQLTVLALDADSGKITTLVDERSKTFIDYSQKSQRHWLDSRGQLLWASERDGYNHLYRYDTKTGKLLNQVTQGPWVVRSLEAVDEEAGHIWFMAMGIHPDQDPYHQHLARVDFDGTNLVVLTQANGTHECELNGDRSLFIDRWSRIDQSPVTELRDAKGGRLIAELGREDTAALLEEGFVPAQPFAAKGRDGQTDIFGLILRPSNFDPDRKYPVLEAIYAGPHGHHVPKKWSLQLGDRRMADLGFIVVRIDGMGTNWRSKAFHDVCWQNLKDGGFPDRIAWMQAAAQSIPQMDLTRVGIYGGSAGGQNALAALLHHGDFYHAAAADCGCHDNRMDKIWWNEAWMGELGPHYADSSNVTHASRLQGKLLLTVGELDRNVDPASTLQVVDALIRADKEFEFVLVPGAGHGVGESPYLFRKRQDFFVRALYGHEPRH